MATHYKVYTELRLYIRSKYWLHVLNLHINYKVYNIYRYYLGHPGLNQCPYSRHLLCVSDNKSAIVHNGVEFEKKKNKKRPVMDGNKTHFYLTQNTELIIICFTGSGTEYQKALKRLYLCKLSQWNPIST